MSWRVSGHPEDGHGLSSLIQPLFNLPLGTIDYLANFESQLRTFYRKRHKLNTVQYLQVNCTVRSHFMAFINFRHLTTMPSVDCAYEMSKERYAYISQSIC